MRNASGHHGENERQRKKKQKQVRHFFIKRLTRKFMEVSRCICAKQRQRNVQNKVHFFAAFLLIRPIVVFPPFSFDFAA